MHKLTILGIGNILQRDDGIGVYATAFLKKNYEFTPSIHFKEGGVAGMALLDTIEESCSLIILDSIEINDAPGSIYVIPANELGGYGINCGGAHEIGVLECLDMLELQGKELPNAAVIGIVPQEIDLQIGLSASLKEHFNDYVKTIISAIIKLDFKVGKRKEQYSLQEIIDRFKD